jgi:DNA-directed RNA polymerase subunit RPC12/RpoP
MTEYETVAAKDEAYRKWFSEKPKHLNVVERVKLETVTGYKCEACDMIKTDRLEVKLYRCKECDELFNQDNSNNGKHQCPECYKFGAKEDDYSCVECEKGPLEEMEAFMCPRCTDDTVVYETEDEVKDHVRDDHMDDLIDEWWDSLEKAEDR